MLARMFASALALVTVFGLLYLGGYRLPSGESGGHSEMTGQVEGEIRDKVKAKGSRNSQGRAMEKPEWMVLGGDAIAQARAAARPTEKAVNCKSKQAMPNLVGMDVEDAQELMERRGAFAFYKTDVTGRRRALLWDRNWIVVRQSPEVCVMIDRDSTVDVWARKKSDI